MMVSPHPKMIMQGNHQLYYTIRVLVHSSNQPSHNSANKSKESQGQGPNFSGGFSHARVASEAMDSPRYESFARLGVGAFLVPPLLVWQLPAGNSCQQRNQPSACAVYPRETKTISNHIDL